jgi:SAM-dependent methyltransferase
MIMPTREHWEHVYQTKQPHEVSWTQNVPRSSLQFIQSFGLPLTAGVIDIGGGDSTLVDHLLDLGYEDVTVLDISPTAIERAKTRLGERANKVNWIVSDITEFVPTRTYDIWHDRAAFHFLIQPEHIEQYLNTAYRAVNHFLTLATFSTAGPMKCSGLEVRRYDQSLMETQLEGRFERMECITEDHTTPFGTTQNFLFCSFRKSD